MSKAFRIASIGAHQTANERLYLFEYRAKITGSSHEEDEGERVHCLLKMRIAADDGRHHRTDVELKQDAGDMILFARNPGPHCKISELGEASSLARVGDCAIYFYPS